jgi:phosphoglycolate phosphatase-like HAD superfamily hydrolase
MAPEPALAIVDIDGVVADVRHRLHHVEARPKNWRAFFAAAGRDPVHEEGVALVERLARDHEVVFVTGRPESLRDDTVAWLERHGMGGHALVMRPQGDSRPAAQLKVHLLRRLARDRAVAAVVDDDALVIEALREAGYPAVRADWADRSDDEGQALLAAQELDGRT